MPYRIDKNTMMDKLRAGEMVYGLQLRSRSVLIAELAGILGFDYVYIDQEHFACNDETVENLVRAAGLSDVTPIIRVRDNDAETIMHVLDIGVKGVILPHIDTAEDAQRMVDAGKFPPQGKRGSGAGSRAASFGACPSDYYYTNANPSNVMIPMIESLEGVENLEAILDTGVDIIRVGRGDLALSMGLHGRQDDPRFVAALRKITETCKHRGVPVGTSATSIETARYYKDLGFTMLTYVSDLDYLYRNVSRDLCEVREALRD